MDILILALLESGPRHGYEIKKRAESILINELELNNNLLYPALKRLEADGYIKPDGAKAGAGSPRKRYRITANGRKRLKSLLTDYGDVEAVMENEFLVRMAFFDLLDGAERESIVGTRRDELESKAGRLSSLLADCRSAQGSLHTRGPSDERLRPYRIERPFPRGRNHYGHPRELRAQADTGIGATTGLLSGVFGLSGTALLGPGRGKNARPRGERLPGGE
jgi:DNA-binding PadR family transcriptional regulator